MLQFSAPKPPSQASALMDSWSRISRQHMSGGAGCGCGFGGLILQASDFELDIVEFLIDEAKTDGRSALPSFIETVARRGADRFSIMALLKAIDTDDDRLEEADRTFALERLATTLDSIDSAHGKGRFSCD